MCFFQIFTPDSNIPFLHPPCFNKTVLVKTTNDFYVAKSNGQFSIFILFGFPVNFFPLLETLLSLDSWYSNSLGCPLSSFYTNHFFLVFSANSFFPPDFKFWSSSKVNPRASYFILFKITPGDLIQAHGFKHNIYIFDFRGEI